MTAEEDDEFDTRLDEQLNSLNFVEWISNRIKFGVRDIPPKCLKMAVAVLSRQLFS